MKISGISISPQGGQTQSPSPGEASGPGRGGSDFSLSSGQLLKGEVAGFSPDGRVFLNIGGRIIEARSEVALKPGAVFWFEVERAEPLWLRLAGQKGAAQEFLRQYFAEPAVLGKGLQALMGQAAQGGASAEFAGLGLGSEANPGQVIRTLAALGLVRSAPEGGEGKKAAALLAGLIRNAGGPEGKAEMVVLQKLGLLIELQQQLNAAAPASQQGQFFLLPCFFALGAGHGQWLLVLDRDDGRETAGEERGYALSFFLAMSRLGELQIQLKVRGKALSGEFLVENAGARDDLAAGLGGLERLLKGLGYAQVVLACRVAQNSMLESFKAGIEAAAGLERVSLVDLRA